MRDWRDTKKYIGDIEKVYHAGELLEEFCSETICTICPLRELCRKADRKKSLSKVIMESIRK